MTIKVLLAEDSAFQRKIVTEMLLSHREITNVDIARNGREAIEKIEKLNPDVLILDLIMPEVDGLTAFKFLSEHYPIPTIFFSGTSPENLDDSVQALLLGALDFIVKPSGLWKEELPKVQEKLISSVLYAAKIKKKYEKRNDLIKKSISKQSVLELGGKSEFKQPTKSKPLPPPKILRSKLGAKLIVIGTSTGGPRTLKFILKKIPQDFPSPILIVQHLDPYFMKQLSKSLDQVCTIKVKIAEDGEKILPGNVYLSPGGRHMKVVARSSKPYIKTFDDKPVNFCKPSVDVLFFSAAEVYKSHTLGILLTGLGNDGAQGLKAIKSKGGITIAESEETSVIYGMPKAAVKIGAVTANNILPNYKINDYMIKFAKKNA
ncbi:MAG: protein-glutamate methylesterase/protein-glutamine glutaminase [Promethearchaeota archaeon]|jgi:two-component system chemotaxis response regulator CheB